MFPSPGSLLALGGRRELALEVTLKEIAILAEVFDGVVVVRARPLHLLLEVPRVLAGIGPTCLLLACAVGSSDELNVVALAVLLVPPVPLLVSLVPLLGVSPTIFLAKVGSDNFLARGMAGHDVKQLPRRARLVAPKLMYERLVGYSRYEGVDHIGDLHIGKVVALLGEAANVLVESFTRFLPNVAKLPGVT